jgi:hypothetical protein
MTEVESGTNLFSFHKEITNYDWKMHMKENIRLKKSFKMTVTYNKDVFSYGHLSDFLKSDFLFHIHFSVVICDFLVFPPPERSVYTHLSPWFLGGKSEYILKFPPHTQFSPFALIDYTRAITPIRGRPYGDFCRAFDAEEGRSPLFFSICNTFWNISQWLQFDPYVLFLAMAAMLFLRRIYNSQTIVYTP